MSENLDKKNNRKIERKREREILFRWIDRNSIGMIFLSFLLVTVYYLLKKIINNFFVNKWLILLNIICILLNFAWGVSSSKWNFLVFYYTYVKNGSKK